MKFYIVTCHTPFVGEENDFYIKSNDEADLRRQIDECVYDNGLEWYDERALEECDMSEDDYYADCDVTSLKEITKEEYLEYCPWDEGVV